MSKRIINKILRSEIDGTEFSSTRKFIYYLNRIGVTQKEYYDKYVRPTKPVTDGICVSCGKESIFDTVGVGYTKFCSLKCSGVYKSSDTAKKIMVEKSKKTRLLKYGDADYTNVDKIKKTKLERYGDENYVNSSKAKQTNLEKYGSITCTGTDEYKKKYEATCLEKYGVCHHTKSEFVKEKNRETCLEKYGVEHVLQSPEIRERINKTVEEKYGGFTLASPVLVRKMKETMVEKYGVENPLQSEEIKDRQQSTNVEKYGGITPTKSKSVIRKIKSTNLIRYGVDNTFNTLQVKNTFLEKYGVTNACKIPGHSEKVKFTCLEKYGNEKFILSDAFIEKSKKTCLEKYGYEYAIQSPSVYIPLMKKLGSKQYKIKDYILKNGNFIRYQSQSELEFIQFCENKNILIRNGPILDYQLYGKTHVYYVDFIITDSVGTRLVEIKRKHQWWFRDVKSGKIKAKTKAAISYSKKMGYLPYKILFETKSI